MNSKKNASPNSRRMKEATKVSKKSRYCKSQAVKLLEALAMDEARRKYPTVPHLAPRIYRDDNANGLTKCIIHFLKLSGHQAERISNTGRIIDRRFTYVDVLGNRRQVGSKKWIPGSGTNGTADISATIAGKSVKIEIKIGKDRQSQAQKTYQEAVEAAGGTYTIASSFEHFYQWYNQNFRP